MENSAEIEGFLKLVEESIKNKNYLRWVVYADKLLRLLRHKTAFEPDDVVKEVILKTVNGERKWDGRINIHTFMFNTIRSVISNLLKGQKRLIYTEDNEFNDTDYFDEMETGYDFSNHLELDNITEKCLRILNKEEGTILLERIDGKKNKEIANELNIPVSKVNNKVRTIRKKILSKGKSLFYLEERRSHCNASDGNGIS